MTLKEITNLIARKYSISIGYKKAWRTREIAREQIFENIEKRDDFVYPLRGKLKRRNPANYVQIEIEADKLFQRMFVSFQACVQGFKLECKTFIDLDGGHLRSKYMGSLLTTTILDGNNRLFPTVFVVIESENLVSIGSLPT